MIIRDTTWKRIREQFSEDEKDELRTAICGESICPRGIVIDQDKPRADLALRVVHALRDAGNPKMGTSASKPVWGNL